MTVFHFFEFGVPRVRQCGGAVLYLREACRRVRWRASVTSVAPALMISLAVFVMAVIVCSMEVGTTDTSP
ncbi:MAG: hypothetical protein U0X87_04640 [Anaerolineales bacterium]